MIKCAWVVVALACALTQASIVKQAYDEGERNTFPRDADGAKTVKIQHESYHQTEQIIEKQEPKKNIRAKQSADNSFSNPQPTTLITVDDFHDWQNCAQISEAVIDVGLLIYNFTQEVKTVKSVFYDGIKNLTHCNQSTTYSKFECVAGAIENVTVYYVTKTKGIMYWFERLNEVIENVATRFANCFGFKRDNSGGLLANIEQIFTELWQIKWYDDFILLQTLEKSVVISNRLQFQK